MSVSEKSFLDYVRANFRVPSDENQNMIPFPSQLSGWGDLGEHSPIET